METLRTARVGSKKDMAESDTYGAESLEQREILREREAASSGFDPRPGSQVYGRLVLMRARMACNHAVGVEISGRPPRFRRELGKWTNPSALGAEDRVFESRIPGQ